MELFLNAWEKAERSGVKYVDVCVYVNMRAYAHMTYAHVWITVIGYVTRSYLVSWIDLRVLLITHNYIIGK